MNREMLKERLEKFPITLLLVLFLGYLAYDYSVFMNDPASLLTAKKTELKGAKEINNKIQERVKQANEYVRNLEAKTAEIRRLAVELEGMKATLTESLDVPGFMKMAITEAKKVGLVVLGLKPTALNKSEYYVEQAFELNFRGVYVQLLVFLDRLSQAQKIVRVDNFSIKPKGGGSSRYVELEGTVQIKTYYYLGSKADELGRTESLAPASVPPSGSPATPPTPVSSGGGT